MSFRSYQRNVERGVAGPDLPVCLPAALEQVSPDHSYRPGIYRAYRKMVETPGALACDELGEMYERLFWPLGELSLEDVVFKRANTERGFVRTAGQLLRDGYRIVTETRNGNGYSTHAVGLIPTDQEGFVVLASNHIKPCLYGVVSLQKIAKHIAHPLGRPSGTYPFHGANITALPQ